MAVEVISTETVPNTEKCQPDTRIWLSACIKRIAKKKQGSVIQNDHDEKGKGRDRKKLGTGISAYSRQMVANDSLG